MVLALAGAAMVLLLIACINLTHLLLARALQRQRELTVRAALGASAERLVRQQLTESLLLAGGGGLIGVALAALAVPLIARLVPTALPIAEVPGVDLRMLALAAGVTLTTGIGFGLFPALRVARARTFDALREGPRAGHGRGAERLRSGLVVAEVAASVVLLVAAGLLIRALWRVQQRRSRLHGRRRADDADGAADAGLSRHGTQAAVLRSRAHRGARAAGRAERRVHQLPADGDARRHLAGGARRARQTTPPNSAASACAS